MAAAIFIRVVSRHGKVTMRYWMKPLTAPPGGPAPTTKEDPTKMRLGPKTDVIPFHRMTDTPHAVKHSGVRLAICPGRNEAPGSICILGD
ncbi:hypothetical protein AVEN_106008-1 [Araneus ventricosus]|nr:hypothetical protein AVEN_116940-1 [Araneus ventricosus]GBN43159.1 hypothetical protein AVEN_32369-1 [Araneus ventricosus]GBN43890.1 hypothetical protein AVEN_106008-1 [Araneus ventricosus]